MTRRRGPNRTAAVLPMVAMLVCLAGCGRRRVPRTADVPTLPSYTPGIFADINPKWAHDGDRIAFLRNTPDRKLQLFIVDTDLERPLALLEAELVSPDRPYASETMRYCSPDTLAWSSDDRLLAFERAEWFTFEDGDRIPGTGLWAFDTLSGISRPLAVHPGHYTSYFYYYHTPEWSPDGRYLAFVGEGINGQRRIFIHPLKGQKPTSAASRYDQYDDSDWPTWRPPSNNGSAVNSRPVLALRQGVKRGLLAPPTETMRVFSPGDASQATCRQIVRVPAKSFYSIAGEPQPKGERVSPRTGAITWSPDGEQIAYTLTPSARDYSRYELWVVNADGSDARRVSPRNGRGYIAPVWIGNNRLGALSPAGNKFDVVILPVRSDLADVTKIGTIGGSDCDWSPDRSQVVWAGPPQYRSPDPDEPTTLHIFTTGITVRRGSYR